MSNIALIVSRIEEIKKEQSALALELEELQIARRVVERLGTVSQSVAASHGNSSARAISAMRVPRVGTTRDLFLDVLGDNQEIWMTAAEVRIKASARKGVDIPMGTVSPTLTELKNIGLVARDGMKVALATRIPKKNEAPDAEALEPTKSLYPGDQSGAV